MNCFPLSHKVPTLPKLLLHMTQSKILCVLSLTIAILLLRDAHFVGQLSSPPEIDYVSNSGRTLESRERPTFPQQIPASTPFSKMSEDQKSRFWYPAIHPDEKEWQLSVNCSGAPRSDTNEKPPIVVHYHIQHNAGTFVYTMATKSKVECVSRCCSQEERQCFVSYNETLEAENLKRTGLTYVPYETMLPKGFSLPFVKEELRKDFYFTTIFRDPFSRFLSSYKRNRKNGMPGPVNFWADAVNPKPRRLYHPDNLPVRWLAGVETYQPLDSSDLLLAKCRLELFDLVMTDETATLMVRKVLAVHRNWTLPAKWGSDKTQQQQQDGQELPNPLGEEIDRAFLGAWLERHRPSFELYDYARMLTAEQLEREGLLEEAAIERKKLEIPSYVQAVLRYSQVHQSNVDTKNQTFAEGVFGYQTSLLGPKTETPKHLKRVSPEECQPFHNMWLSGPDVVPSIFGIHALQ